MGRPEGSKTCQASAPPFCQPVPSVQTRIVSPRAFAATAGCFRPLAGPGGEVAGDTVRVFRIDPRIDFTCPSVSQAARTPAGLGERGAAHRAGADPPGIDRVPLEAGAMVAGGEQDHVPFDGRRGGPVEHVDRPPRRSARARVPQQAQAPVAVHGGLSAAKVAPSSLDLATHIRRPTSPVGGVLGPAVPGHVDAALPVGRDRAAAVEAGGPLHQVALRLEGRPPRPTACRAWAPRRPGFLGRARASRSRRRGPGPPCPRAICAAADGPHRDGAAGLAVDADRRGEGCRAGLVAGVEEVAAGRVALEVDQVDRPLGVDRRLGLDAAVGCLRQSPGSGHLVGGAGFRGRQQTAEANRGPDRQIEESHERALQVIMTVATTRTPQHNARSSPRGERGLQIAIGSIGATSPIPRDGSRRFSGSGGGRGPAC